MQTHSESIRTAGARVVDSDTDRRGLPRRPVIIPAIAVCADGAEYRCILRDMSLTGARIGIPRRHRLPRRFKLVTGARLHGFPMRLAWQRGDFAGLILEADLPA